MELARVYADMDVSNVKPEILDVIDHELSKQPEGVD
jgi:hypothetical protein